MTEKEIYEKAIATFGKLQIIKTIEEMAELQKELCKVLLGKKNPGPLAEEIADVEIMLEQMKIMFDNVLLVIGWRAEKLDRLEKRLEGKKE